MEQMGFLQVDLEIYGCSLWTCIISYNIILGFAHSSQSLVGHPDSIGSVKEGLLKELTVQ